MSAFGVKRTFRSRAVMSANDPQQSFPSARPFSLKAAPQLSATFRNAGHQVLVLWTVLVTLAALPFVDHLLTSQGLEGDERVPPDP